MSLILINKDSARPVGSNLFDPKRLCYSLK